MSDLEDVVRELKGVNELLGGRYDSKSSEFIKGIDGYLHGIELNSEEATQLLDGMKTKLDFIEHALNKLNDIVNEMDQRLVAANARLASIPQSVESTKQSWFGFVACAGMVAILGTLRNWF